MIKYYYVLLLFSATLCPLNDYAQLVINEVSAANYDDYQGNAGSYEDWFELYNGTGADIDLNGYYLSDDILDPTKYQVNSSVIIPSGGYSVVFASGRDQVAGSTVHTNFKITQGKQEYAVLANPAGTIIDTWWLDDSNQKNHSFGRNTDGDVNWVVFTNPTPGASNTGGYAGYADRPIFSVDAGLYSGSVSVSISAPGLDIRYTTDGSTPTIGSNLYSSPVNISTTTVLRARSFSNSPDILPSFTESNTYFIDENHTVKIISISGDQVMDFIMDNAPGSFSNDFEGAFEYFDSNFSLIDEGEGDYNKHGNDSWAYDQRGIDFIMRDEFGYNNTIHDDIFQLSDKQEFQRLIIKAAANDNYPAENGAHIRDAFIHELSMVANLKLDERAYEPCVMYVNGEYWGVYELREKADDLDYTRFYYDQGTNEVDYLKTWGGTWSEYGNGEADWDALVDYILNNDMTDNTNYQYVTTQLNTGSLIDYFILNSYVVASDWLNWNTAWWRGTNPNGDHKKWGYVLWDLDATFGHYINYTDVPTQDADANPCDPETLGDPGGQGHVPILNALLENELFYQDYVSRYADLSSGHLSCDNLHALLNQLTDRIAPEMPQQIDRWGGSYTEWEQNVQEIHDYIDERCVVIEEGIVDCYDVEGPFEVVVEVQPPGAGWVQYNTIEITDFPWQGTYYGGLDVDLEANAYGTNVFSHWELLNHTVFDPSSDTASFTFATTDTIIAYFVTTTTDLTLQVFPDGAGSIDFLSNNYNTFPTTVDAPEEVDLDAMTSSNGNFFVFDHWEIASSTLVTDPNLDNVTININGPDTLTAYYTELENYNIVILSEGSDEGVITFDNETIEDLPFSGQFLANEEYDITATPPENYHFIYWILGNNILTLDPTISSNSFFITGNDTLIAVFEEDLHYFLTLEVIPPEAGSIDLNSENISLLPYTEKFYIGEFAIQLEAIPNEFYNFVNWKSKYHDIGNSANNQYLSLTLEQSDTITANFLIEPFNFWLPNAFSPNEDGHNDIWKAHGTAINVDRYEINIFDRYGQVVFQSNDIEEGWNGSGVNNKEFYSKDGAYTYLLKVQSAIDGESYEFSGFIILVR